MGRFHSTDGFVHFVFANYTDTYFLPSLVQLDLNGYLYYSLKKQGYKGIFFAGGLEGDYELRLYDEASRQCYGRYEKKGKGLWGLFGGSGEENARRYPLGAPEAFLGRLTAMLKKERDLAFVFRLDSFCDLFSDVSPSLLAEFSQVGRRHVEQNGNILVLLAPATAGGSFSCLTNPDGPLCRGDSGKEVLCPELRRMLKEEGNDRLYARLARELGPRCVFLNEFTRPQLTLVAKYFCMVWQKDWDGSQKSIQNLADFLFAWYRSAALREYTGPILPANETRQTVRLLQELENHASWLSIRRAMSALGEPEKSMLGALKDRFGLEPEENRILADDLLARRIRQLRIPRELYQDMPVLGRSVMEKFRKTAAAYQTPWIHPPEEALERELMQCVTILEQSAAQGDTATFERAVQCLATGVSRGFAYGEKDRKIWQCQMSILRLSQDVFRIDGLIREDTGKLETYRQEKRRMIADIEARRAGRASVTGLTSADQELSIQMHGAVSLERQIENLTRARAVKQERRTESLNALQNLELAVSSIGLGGHQHTEQVLQDAVETIERDVVAGNAAEEKLQELGKTLGYVMQEAQRQPDELDVAAAYEKLLQSSEAWSDAVPLEN